MDILNSRRFPIHNLTRVEARPPANAGGSDPLRQFSWISFLLMTLMLITSSCTVDNQIAERLPNAPQPSPTQSPRPPEKIDRDLERAIEQTAQAAQGKVGVGALLLETGDAAYLNRNGQTADRDGRRPADRQGDVEI